MNKKQLIVMSGIPGSGKDYWIDNHKGFFISQGTTEVVSRDKIRFNLLKDGEDYFAHEGEVYKEFINQLKESIKYNDVTIANATHLNGGSRGKLLRSLSSVLKNGDVEINAMVIKTPLKTCLSQNAGREGLAVVPADQIKRMNSSFSIPTIEEGFDNIYIYKIKDNIPMYEVIKNE